MYSIEMKRSWSDPCHVRLTSPLRRAVSLPYLSTPLLNAGCIALSVSNDHLVAQFDLPHPLALPEITHAYESEDGVDPLHASLCQDTKCTRRGSLVRYCVEHISSFSNSSIARLNRSLRALWPSSKWEIRSNFLIAVWIFLRLVLLIMYYLNWILVGRTSYWRSNTTLLFLPDSIIGTNGKFSLCFCLRTHSLDSLGSSLRRLSSF